MVKILTICPYEDYMLKAIVQTQVAGLAEFINIGSRKKIIEVCYLHKIDYHKLTIIDVVYEMEICFIANEILNKNEDIIGVIFGNFSKGFQKNIVNITSDVSIIDVPKASHLLIIPRYINEDFVGFEEKKQAIIVAKDLLNRYEINYHKIALVTGKMTNTLTIEKNIIKLEDGLDSIDIININQIFADGYNVLIFNNTDAANIFIETLLMVDKSKYANIKKASKHFVVDACEMKFKDLFFSIFMVSKIRLNTEAS